MKRPLLLVLVGAVLIGLRVRTAHEARREVEQQQAAAVRDAAADSAFADSVLRAAEDIGAEVEVVGSALPAPVRDANEIRLALEAYAAGTYIGEMFAERDSMNYRWPERVNAPLAVWVQTATLDPEGADWPRLVHESFHPWIETGIPVSFLPTEASARADVRVTWVERYESRTTGRTRWVRDQHGWITAASIELARTQPDGRPLDDAIVGAIARHEVGHLLGLTHTADETNIMSARVRGRELREADRATVRLVYKLPPGSVRAAP